MHIINKHLGIKSPHNDDSVVRIGIKEECENNNINDIIDNALDQR